MNPERNTNRLIIISAPSGAGKTTLCHQLLRDFPNEVCLSISSTTRKPRKIETQGKDYHFLSEEAFQKGIEEGQFAEWALVHDHYYGTSKSFIDQALASGKSVLLDIDVQGAESLRKAYGSRCLTIFVAPPGMEILLDRLKTRGTDSEEAISRRIKNAKSEMKKADEFDYTIINDDLPRAYGELKHILRQHGIGVSG